MTTHPLECACHRCVAPAITLAAVIAQTQRRESAQADLWLRTAAKRASQDYGVAEHAVLSRLQRLHGQGTKRGRPHESPVLPKPQRRGRLLALAAAEIASGARALIRTRIEHRATLRAGHGSTGT
jgi:hypothetical protein